MDEESISDANNVTADTISYMSNTKLYNENLIFTCKKLDKLDKLKDRLKDLTINNTKYYASNSSIASDSLSEDSYLH